MSSFVTQVTWEQSLTHACYEQGIPDPLSEFLNGSVTAEAYGGYTPRQLADEPERCVAELKASKVWQCCQLVVCNFNAFNGFSAINSMGSCNSPSAFKSISSFVTFNAVSSFSPVQAIHINSNILVSSLPPPFDGVLGGVKRDNIVRKQSFEIRVYQSFKIA